MLIQTDKLKRRPRQIDIEEPARGFVVLHELIEQGVVAFNAPIRGSLTAVWAGQIIEVTGQLTTSVTIPCGRCLTPVSSDLRIDVQLCYRGRHGEEEPLPDEQEVKTEELGLIAFSGTDIDLRPDIDQEIIMALPPQVVCGSDCQGLCPVCGSNRNLEPCTCEPPVFHAGLAALKNFKVDP